MKMNLTGGITMHAALANMTDINVDDRDGITEDHNIQGETWGGILPVGADRL